MAGLLTITEICDQKNISRATIYRYLDEGMPCTKVGKKNMFDSDEVDEFIAQRKDSNGTIVVGQSYANLELSKFFRVGAYGRIRKSNSKKAIVCITSPNVARLNYEDYWMNDILYFYGQGRKDNYSIDNNYNSTLRDAKKNGFTIYLFENFKQGSFVYRGIAEIVGDVVTETIEEENTDGSWGIEKREVCKFPLKLINENDYVPKELLDEEISIASKETENLSNDDIIKHASEKTPTSIRKVVTKQYQRNMFVARYAKMRANGICELCGMKAPFELNGEGYLEVSHLIPLSQGGEDTIENVAALCPNCHRKIHLLELPEDIEIIKDNVKKDEQRLQ